MFYLAIIFLGTAQHMVILLVLKQGEYDNILAWPFNKKVKIGFIGMKVTKSITKFHKLKSYVAHMGRPTQQYHRFIGTPDEEKDHL